MPHGAQIEPQDDRAKPTNWSRADLFFGRTRVPTVFDVAKTGCNATLGGDGICSD